MIKDRNKLNGHIEYTLITLKNFHSTHASFYSTWLPDVCMSADKTNISIFKDYIKQFPEFNGKYHYVYLQDTCLDHVFDFGGCCQNTCHF